MVTQRAGVAPSAFHPPTAIDLVLHVAVRVVDPNLCRERASRRVGIDTPRGGGQLRAGIGRRGYRRERSSQSATTGNVLVVIPLVATCLSA